MAHRIISVGADSRARKLAAMLDGWTDSADAEEHGPVHVHVVKSSRGFSTYTGRFHGVPVSVVATGMGLAMADFVAREVCFSLWRDYVEYYST